MNREKHREKNVYVCVYILAHVYIWASLVAQLLPAMRDTWGSIPGLGRSPGEGKGYPFQYSGLENSMDCKYVCVYMNHSVVYQKVTQHCKSTITSVTRSCLTLRNPMDCSMLVFPVHHLLPEPAQTHVHWVGDWIQPSHALSSLYSPAFNLSQHQGLFQWASSSHQVAKVLEFQLQLNQSILNEYSGLTSFNIDWFDLLADQGTLRRLLQHQSFKSINSSMLNFLYNPTLTSIHDYWKRPTFN